MKMAIAILLLGTFALAANANSEYGGHKEGFHSKFESLKPLVQEFKQQYKQEYKPVYKPEFKPVYKPQPVYYCTYFYYDNGYCPSGDWYQSFQTAVDTYAKANKDVYGCSFGDEYNYGYQAAPDTQGGYICFKTEESPMKFFNWFYTTDYCTDFAPYQSDNCHYKVVQSDNLPTCQYTYSY